MSQAQDFSQIRENMVDCQIHPMGVVREDILDAFMSVPREEFVPEAMRGVAYSDEDLDIGQGRYLLEPSIIARLMEEASLQPDDVVLTIGSGAGYTAALLSKIVSTVVSLEEDADLLNKAQSVWDAHGFCNIVGIAGCPRTGAQKHAPFSLVIINGCVAEVPDEIKDQIADGGRILALIGTAGQNVAKATLLEKTKGDGFSSRVLFDAHTPYLKGFEPEETFVF